MHTTCNNDNPLTLSQPASSLGRAEEIRQDQRRSSHNHTSIELRAGQRGNLARCGWWPAHAKDHVWWWRCFCLLTPTPRSLPLRRDGYITAESVTWAARGMERLVTAWVCMNDRKNGSAGVSWDSCTQQTEIEARPGPPNGEPHSS